MVWWMVGASRRTDQDNTKEGSGKSASEFRCIADSCSGNRKRY